MDQMQLAIKYYLSLRLDLIICEINYSKNEKDVDTSYLVIEKMFLIENLPMNVIIDDIVKKW